MGEGGDVQTRATSVNFRQIRTIVQWGPLCDTSDSPDDESHSAMRQLCDTSDSPDDENHSAMRQLCDTSESPDDENHPRWDEYD